MQLPELIKLLEKDYPLAQDQESLRYGDEYTTLEEEQQKLNSMHGEKPDYAKIIEQGLKLSEQGAGHFCAERYGPCDVATIQMARFCSRG